MRTRWGVDRLTEPALSINHPVRSSGRAGAVRRRGPRLARLSRDMIATALEYQFGVPPCAPAFIKRTSICSGRPWIIGLGRPGPVATIRCYVRGRGVANACHPAQSQRKVRAHAGGRPRRAAPLASQRIGNAVQRRLRLRAQSRTRRVCLARQSRPRPVHIARQAPAADG